MFSRKQMVYTKKYIISRYKRETSNKYSMMTFSRNEYMHTNAYTLSRPRKRNPQQVDVF